VAQESPAVARRQWRSLSWKDDTGKIDEKTTFDSSDFRNTVPRFSPENRKANQALVELLARIAHRKNATPRPRRLADQRAGGPVFRECAADD